MVEAKATKTVKVMAAANFPADCTSLAIGFNTPKIEQRSINGVSFTISSTRYDNGNQFCITTDLTDLMAKIPAIVAAQSMPSNNCASYVKPNPVVLIHHATLKTSNDAATLHFNMDGKATFWLCVPGPPQPHSEWIKATRKPFRPGYLRVWTTPGPDHKTIQMAPLFSEFIPYTLAPVSGGAMAYDGNQATYPLFNPQVPEVDLRNLIRDSLVAAIPTLKLPGGPTPQVDGARYVYSQSQIWGTQ